MEVKYAEKPEKWPNNAREYVLDRVLNATEEFRDNPSYITKERLLSWISDYDLNQRSYLGLYDRDAAKQELNFLMDVIDKFKMSNQDKKKFLEEILQYWILSVKDSKWEKERERRYVLFIYLEYDYKEMEIDDGWLKLKTSIFLLPDFILGNNPSKIEIQRQIDGKRKGTSMKDYIFCKNCLSRDYDAIIANVNKCPICGSTNIENVYLRDEEEI